MWPPILQRASSDVFIVYVADSGLQVNRERADPQTEALFKSACLMFADVPVGPSKASPERRQEGPEVGLEVGEDCVAIFASTPNSSHHLDCFQGRPISILTGTCTIARSPRSLRTGARPSTSALRGRRSASSHLDLSRCVWGEEGLWTLPWGCAAEISFLESVFFFHPHSRSLVRN